jgi:tetratricopeptide (TPR) repeat protein
LGRFFQRFAENRTDLIEYAGDRQVAFEAGEEDWPFDTACQGILSREFCCRRRLAAARIGVHEYDASIEGDLFEHYYRGEAGKASRRAFAQAMGTLGHFYVRQYEHGHRAVLSVVAAEEDNLLAAWRIAQEHALWDCVIGAMQGLRILYEGTAPTAAWRRLVESVVPHLVDPVTDGPIAGCDEEWGFINDYRVQIALDQQRDWGEAERLQLRRVDWDRKNAKRALEVPADTWDETHRSLIRRLAVGLHLFAQIKREKGDSACATAYLEALELARSIGDKAMQAACAFNLGSAYMDVSGLRDLDEAEGWYRRSLDLFAAADSSGRANALSQLGKLAGLRFLEARTTNCPPEELALHLTKAAQLSEQSLELTPQTDIRSRAVTCNQLGNIYGEAGNTDRALKHYQEAVRYNEQAGDIFIAGSIRYNVAITLVRSGRLHDALAYAQAALANHQEFGERAVAEIQETERLIAWIKEAQAKERGT